MSDALFPDIDPTPTKPERPETAPRYETANRSQIALCPWDLEARLPADHRARLIWRFVEQLPLDPFYAEIGAREHWAGRPAIDPKILVALWLYATITGVGSARELERLCGEHDAYRWICGGVSVNYHTLSDFRVAHGEALTDLLIHTIGVLLHKRVVTLRRVAQDGTRIRASAGAASFRRRATLEQCLAEAQRHVDATTQQPEGAGARQTAARQRAARQRETRLQAALAELPQVEAVKARGNAKTAARVSTTDPEARVMKMADGGFRPAYNVEFATDVDSRVIVGVAVTNVGSDRAQLVPMLEQIEAHTHVTPGEYLVDGGFVTGENVEAAAAHQTILFAPPQKPKGDRDPAAPVPGDSTAEVAWRLRMATPEAHAIYKDRAATAEWVNADARAHRTLGGFVVRGLPKVTCCVLWVALAHNLLRAARAGVSLMSG